MKLHYASHSAKAAYHPGWTVGDRVAKNSKYGGAKSRGLTRSRRICAPCYPTHGEYEKMYNGFLRKSGFQLGGSKITSYNAAAALTFRCVAAGKPARLAAEVTSWR